MENEKVNIQSIEHQTHDVLRIKTEKPDGLEFTPGQATEIKIDKDGWRDEGRPFTFTCLPKHDYLEFMIKTYPSHEGVTEKLNDLKMGDILLLTDIFGAIEYKGEGTFLAGGAGATPFISILRDLKDKGNVGNNKLIFANKTSSDIILKDEFQEMLGDNFINILSKEKTEHHAYGQISEDFLKESGADLNGYFYLCGPPPMMEAVQKQLNNLGVKQDKLVTEDFG